MIGFNTLMDHDSSVFEDNPGTGMFGVIMVKMFIERIENIYNSVALEIGDPTPEIPEYTAFYNILALS